MTPALLAANWRAVAAAGALAAAFGAGWAINGWRADAELAEIRSEHDKAVADAERRSNEAQAEQRAIEQSREDAQKEIAHVAAQARTRDQADRRIADVRHQRMLDVATAAAVSAGRACQDPNSPTGGETATGSVRALADVLGEAGAFAGEMAAATDASRTAGTACEQSYDSLSK